MADVGTSPSGRRRNRGQLILVTGLLVAVAMVSLVLLLNTAIFTENLASRGADQSAREALEYRVVATEGVGDLVDEENDREHPSQTAVEENVTDGIDRIDNYTARGAAIGAQVARINDSTVAVHEGKLIRQTDDSRQFLEDDGLNTVSWDLATEIEDTRAFVMTVNRADLVTTNDSDAIVDGAFAVKLDESADIETWDMYIYENDTTGDVAVATTTGATPTERCSVDGSEVTINLTAGTIEDTPCPGAEWAEGLDQPYDIAYANGDNATGTYNLTVNTTGSAAVASGNLNDGTSNPTSPYFVPAVYSATYTIHYRTDTLEYQADVRVAPGESE